MELAVLRRACGAGCAKESMWSWLCSEHVELAVLRRACGAGCAKESMWSWLC